MHPDQRAGGGEFEPVTSYFWPPGLPGEDGSGARDGQPLRSHTGNSVTVLAVKATLGQRFADLTHL